MTERDKELEEIEETLRNRPDVLRLYELAKSTGPDGIQFTIDELNKKKEQE